MSLGSFEERFSERVEPLRTLFEKVGVVFLLSCPPLQITENEFRCKDSHRRGRHKRLLTHKLIEARVTRIKDWLLLRVLPEGSGNPGWLCATER